MNAQTLLIDIGNSRIKWFVDSAHTPLNAQSTPNALSHHIENWPLTLRDAWSKHSISRCRLSNVAKSDILESVQAIIAELFPHSTVELIRAQNQCAGLTLAYDATQMGADRYAQLLGAQSICAQRNHLVISAGTATTIDGVLANGQHIGGMILPSIELMRKSLHQYTAQLPLLGGQFQPLDAPHNTADALETGAHLASIGAIQSFSDRYMQDLEPIWVLCGGNAAWLIAHTSAPSHLVPALCLLGLKHW